MKLSFKVAWQLTKETFKGFSQDNIPKMSGALAYFTVFSMGPLLVVIISLCGLFFAREAVEGKIYAVLRDFIGQDTAAQLQQIIKTASIGNKSTIAAIIGTVTLILGATGVFAEIQDSINKIWGIKPKPKRGWVKMIKNRFLSFSVIVSLGFLLLVSLVITGIIETISNRLQTRFPQATIVLFYIINLIMTAGISTLVFATIFKVLPDAKIKWGNVIWGSLVTALLFLVGKFGISFYISQTKVGSTFGGAGSLVIILVWIYYSSIILYLGAEFTKAYALKRGEPIYPAEYAVTTTEIEVESKKKIEAKKKTIVKN